MPIVTEDDGTCPKCGCYAEYFVYYDPFDHSVENIVGCDECCPVPHEDGTYDDPRDDDDDEF